MSIGYKMYVSYIFSFKTVITHFYYYTLEVKGYVLYEYEI